MTKLLKTLLKLSAFLILLLIVVVAGIATFVDPNNFKAEINELAQKHTGRSVEIKGTIQWSFTPQVALYIQDIKMGNAAGFEKTFFAAKEAHVKLELMPLLKKDIVISGIELQGLTLTLERRQNGQTNIDDLLNRFPKPTQQDTLEPTQSSHTPNTPEASHNEHPIQIKDITIKNSQFLVFDEQQKQHWTFHKAYLHTKNMSFDFKEALPPVTLKGRLVNIDDEKIDIRIDTTFVAKASTQAIELTALNIDWQGINCQIIASIEDYQSAPAYDNFKSS